MKKIKFLWAMALLMLAAGAMQAQTRSVVRLKNGTPLVCDIMEMRADTITLKTDDGSLLVYPMGEVEQISNTSYIGESRTSSVPTDNVRYKLRRVGRDLHIGRKGVDYNSLQSLLGSDLYNDYRSAYTTAGVGSAFVVGGVLAGGLGVVWWLKGQHEIMQRNGRILCVAAAASLATGIVVRSIGIAKVGRVVRKYNSGRRLAEAIELSPSILGYCDPATGYHDCTLGATFEIHF